MIRIDAWKQNLEYVEDKILQAVQTADRKRDEIRLVVVTKTHRVDIVEELLELGVRDIGESYVQEALEKQTRIAKLGGQYADTQWHMIGHVQSRKAGQVLENFDMLHSVDSLKLARRLNKAALELKRSMPALLQVNVSGEESKYGFDAVQRKDWDALLKIVEQLLELERLEVQGLMSIPPFDVDSQVARDSYAKTRELRDYLAQRFPESNWSELSMGMSSDYESAIHEGSTMLRLGTAILGPRPTK